MHVGHYISGAGHLGLIGWLLWGGNFAPAPEPFEVSEVSVITAEEYAALTAPETAPEASTEAVAPSPPETAEEPPEIPATPTEEPPDSSDPEAAQASDPDEAPDVSEIRPPEPTDAEDTPPEMAPAPSESAALIPEESDQPAPKKAPRVAPEPVAPPEPDSKVDEVRQEERVPEEGAETPAEPQEATAPEEAATEIVTEAEEEPAAAPTASLRPQARPKRSTVGQKPKPPKENDKTDTAAINSALEEALGEEEETAAPQSAAPAGPPLSQGERDALRVAVQRCWNVGSLSSAALATTVIVGVSMERDGRPDTGSIRLIGSEGGSDAAARQAFEAARRAIIRCGANGFDLPEEKYERWQDIEMTFNPENMRIK